MSAQLTRLGALLIKGQLYTFTSLPAAVSTAGNINPLPVANTVNAIYDRECGTGDRTDTTATAAAILAAIPGAVAGTTFTLIVRNVSLAGRTLTIAGGTNVTVQGTATVAQANARRFLGVVTGVGASAAISLYSVGAGAY